ncbi:MAG: aggregation factor core [Alphaproteobacteria bacterium]|nr:aggregation factor core [Alphaproteobacteria bacterium]
MNSLIKTLTIAAGVCACATSLAVADMAVKFGEGAPKDRFTFENNGACTIANAKVTLDLSGSKSGLIFDVTSKGAGVEVFQPLEIVSGGNALRGVPTVKDGDNQITLDISQLDAGKSVSFTIDVDDTMGGREITVSGSEISGARVVFSQDSKSASGTFGSNARTNIQLNACRL